MSGTLKWLTAKWKEKREAILQFVVNEAREERVRKFEEAKQLNAEIAGRRWEFYGTCATLPGPSTGTPFIEEFNSNSDSDLELEEEDMDDRLHRRRNTESILQDSYFEVGNDNEGDQTNNIPANSTWTANATEFE
ncbi:hypothetical protein PoB_005230100 [Plakobranchus ocellatus]|uniref:Uncharacterized protein n=1 Tax=Plakobranchus ocellatus TaxID=259542 RepID=A0AAV4BRB3_9GAST|nr:hypothetical protein PoB_005230100 [Plakobranchus ocellatus]